LITFFKILKFGSTARPHQSRIDRVPIESRINRFNRRRRRRRRRRRCRRNEQEDEELPAEVAEECGRFGPVASCVVKELKAGPPAAAGGGGGAPEHVPEDERVRIFVSFERPDSAIRAFVEMEGRFFGGRRVKCAFFDEGRFAAGDLARTADEDEDGG
jgi:hypothetical protein